MPTKSENLTAPLIESEYQNLLKERFPVTAMNQSIPVIVAEGKKVVDGAKTVKHTRREDKIERLQQPYENLQGACGVVMKKRVQSGVTTSKREMFSKGNNRSCNQFQGIHPPEGNVYQLPKAQDSKHVALKKTKINASSERQQTIASVTKKDEAEIQAAFQNL